MSNRAAMSGPSTLPWNKPRVSRTGEYLYVKPLWALNEIVIATLHVLEQTGAEWAARYYGMAQRVIEEKYSMKSTGIQGTCCSRTAG